VARSRNGHLKDMPGMGGDRLKASQDEADWELFIVCVCVCCVWSQRESKRELESKSEGEGQMKK